MIKVTPDLLPTGYGAPLSCYRLSNVRPDRHSSGKKSRLATTARNETEDSAGTNPVSCSERRLASDHVRNAIERDSRPSAHDAKEMPVWGDLFWRMSQGQSSEVQLWVNNLNRYVESLHAK